MELDSLKLSNEVLFYTSKVHQLQRAVERARDARIKVECNLSGCFSLLKEAIKSGDDVTLGALDFVIRQAAKQARLSIANKPRWSKLMKDIELDRKKVGSMRVATYIALLPFAMKEFECF